MTLRLALGQAEVLLSPLGLSPILMCIFLLYSLPEQFLCPFWIEYLYILVRLGSTVCACLFHPSLRGVRACDVSFPMPSAAFRNQRVMVL